MKNNLLEYIRKSKENTGIYYLNDIPVWTEDPLPDSINLRQVLLDVAKRLPNVYLKYIQAVRIGIFEEMLEKELNALYKDGVLYVSNMQDNNMDMLDDIIHEISHAVEEHNHDLVYEDEEVFLEFLGKRKRLYGLLKSEGYDVIIEQFLTTTYDYDFDMFLFQEIGYPVLETLTLGLFLSPYSVTSINEYFAVGFENFYMGEANYIEKICPILLKKLYYLDELTYDH
tara:strand:+ start:176 stop:856 length:681 start_codon:yes stop_codon:yes gene_type:complete